MTIEVLFPEVANLYGDLGNIEYITRSLEACGKTCEVIDTDLYTRPAFADRDDIDLIYMGPVTEKGQLRVIDSLKPYKDRLEQLIKGGQRFFMTGNAMEVFGEYIECEEGGPHIECLGLFPFITKQRMMQRTSSFWVGQFEGIDIVGYKSQFTHIYPTDTESVKNLFTTEKGEGLNPEMNGEGIKEGGFEGTYLLGPLFVLNPLYMRKFMADLGIEDCTPLYEEAAMEAYKKRLDEYREPGRNYKY